MSNTFNYISSESIQSRLLDEKIFLAKHLINADPNWVSFSQISKAKERAYSNWGRRKVIPSLFVWADKAVPGLQVFRVPENFDGVFDEYDLDEFEVVGTLYRTSTSLCDAVDPHDPYGSWTILTDLKVVEHIRREREYKSMGQGNLSIGRFRHDYVEYRNFLIAQDALNGGVTTRGHGLFC